MLYPLGVILLWTLFWGIPCWAQTPAPSEGPGLKVETGAKEREEVEKA